MNKKFPPGIYQGKDRGFLCPKIFLLLFVLDIIFMAKHVLCVYIILNCLIFLPNFAVQRNDY